VHWLWLVSQSSLSWNSTAVSFCCWTCQIYMTDNNIAKFCSGGSSQQPTRRRFKQKRKESEGLYSAPCCRQKTEDARCRVCGNVRKQISQMWRATGGDSLVMLAMVFDPYFRAGKTTLRLAVFWNTWLLVFSCSKLLNILD